MNKLTNQNNQIAKYKKLADDSKKKYDEEPTESSKQEWMRNKRLYETFMRNKEAVETSRSGKTAINTDTDLDYLDVPAFLRRQAD